MYLQLFLLPVTLPRLDLIWAEAGLQPLSTLEMEIYHGDYPVIPQGPLFILPLFLLLKGRILT
jgi:hypothetical protein